MSIGNSVEFRKFPKIQQFRKVRKAIEGLSRPDIVFTPKLHGTNACVVMNDSCIEAIQSRNQFIDESNDSFGFVKALQTDSCLNQGLREFYKCVRCAYSDDLSRIYVYGEWCGKGINTGTAVNEVEEKFFVPFAVYLEETDEWLEMESIGSLFEKMLPEHGAVVPIYSLSKGAFVFVGETGNELESVLTYTIENLANDIDPFVYHNFGISGKCEGMVAVPHINGLPRMDLAFKVKNPEFNGKSKNKLGGGSKLDPETAQNVNEFVDSAVTEERLRQGVHYLQEMGKPVDETSTGDFLSWVWNDIADEESDQMDRLGLTKKELGKPVATRAREWLFANLDSF